MFHYVSAGVKAVQDALKRTCPSCGQHLKVAIHQLSETVACQNCGTPVPPRTQQA